MNEKQKKFMEKMQLNKPRLYLQIINQNRKLYNQLCRSCQVLTVQNKGKVTPVDYCSTCKNKAEWRMKKIKELVEEAGGKVRE